MSNWLRYIERGMVPTTRMMSGIGAVAVLLMMLLNIADIILRTSLNSPIRGIHEIIEWMMIVTVFLGIPYVQHRKTNISIGLLVDRFPQKAQAITNGLICILSLGIIGIMTWEAFGYFRRMWETGLDSTVLNMPMAPFQFILAFGLLVLCFVLISELLHSLSKGV